MSYTYGQATVPTSATVPLFMVPAGLASVSFWNTGGGAVFIGTSSAVTVTSGMQAPVIPAGFSNYVGSKGATFYGCNTSGTAASIAYCVTTGN
jgi:hypothetical protein